MSKGVEFIDRYRGRVDSMDLIPMHSKEYGIPAGSRGQIKGLTQREAVNLFGKERRRILSGITVKRVVFVPVCRRQGCPCQVCEGSILLTPYHKSLLLPSVTCDRVYRNGRIVR